jgi:hypothetical protein
VIVRWMIKEGFHLFFYYLIYYFIYSMRIDPEKG